MRNRVVTIGLAAAAMSAFLCIGARVALADTESAEAEFKKMDTNGDGKISADEWTAAHKEMFSKMDTNGDGKISVDEMKADLEKHQKMMAKPGAKEMISEKVKMMDTNNDGYISEDEFMASSKTMFDKLDTDHDGYLTKSELKAAHEKMKSKMQEKSGEKMK
jgi:Ca2+-binding EF-hand superfamily protein